MSSLIQGRIVYAKIPIPDPQGRNPKANRPFVVITSNSDLKKNPATVQGIGVSDELSATPEDEYCLLPTESGRFKHGCSAGSAACCRWIEDLNVEDLEWRNGFVVAKVLFAIIEKAKQLRPDVFPRKGSDL